MFRQLFGDIEHLSTPGFGLYFKFDDLQDGSIISSPHYFSDGLGQVESHDGADLRIMNRGGAQGVVIPHPDIGPDAGIWIKSPGIGYKATFWIDSLNGAKFQLLSLKSRNILDRAEDVKPFDIVGKGEKLNCNLHSLQAEWFFLRGGNGEIILRYGTFLKWPP